MCNVGVKPTVEVAGKVVPEVHLLDFDGRDLHGEAIRVAFLARLRDERRFPSVEALRAQIARDVEAARALPPRLSGPPSGPGGDVGGSAPFLPAISPDSPGSSGWPLP